jgi:hypothetical protein
MNYALAKRLKDAGFPQETKAYSRWECPHGFTPWSTAHVCNEPAIKLPTLSDLIEACGDQFIELDRADSQWLAQGGQIVDDCSLRRHKSEVGTTPDEAVANLWFALHTDNNRG